jgi:outer membrane immunogenic protein
MHQMLLGTVAAVAIVTALAGPVAAADLRTPVKATPLPPAPQIVNWTGFYLGGHAGYGWSKVETETPDTDLHNPSVTSSGLALGFHAGYNWQLGPAPWGSWVVGIEGDATSTPGWHKRVCEAERSPDCTSGAQGGLNWLASIRGRLGLAFDRTLIYATGGVAWASGQAWAGTSLAIAELERKVVGGVVGGGIEWKYNPNFSLRLEGLHYMFNNKHTLLDDSEFIRAGIKNASVIRVGASWHPQLW